MEDTEPATYLPSYGDRIALKHFCKHHTPSTKRKLGLFQKLRVKMMIRKEGNEDEPQTSNKKAKCNRNIEIGLLHRDNGVIKQVRKSQCGESRKIQLNVQAGYDDLLKEGNALFFHNGTSTKGHESEFDLEVWDFKLNPLPKYLSIGMIYETVKLPMLRFYIATCPKCDMTEKQYSDAFDSSKDDDWSAQKEYEQQEINEPCVTPPDVFLIYDEDIISVDSSEYHTASMSTVTLGSHLVHNRILKEIPLMTHSTMSPVTYLKVLQMVWPTGI